MSQPLIIDLHLDLAWDALFWNRNLTLTAHQVRQQEAGEPPQVASDYNVGLCTVTFPEMRRGSVGIMLSTIMSRIDERRGTMRDGMRTQEQAIAMGRGHLAYYQVMVKRGQIKPVRSIQDLNEAVEAWKTPAVDTPIYHVLSMESADPIIDPDDVEFWWKAGLRVVGPAHFGHNTYIHGTNTVGGLKPPARDLYRVDARGRNGSGHHTHGRSGRLGVPGNLGRPGDGFPLCLSIRCEGAAPPDRRHDSRAGAPGRRHRPGVLPDVHRSRGRVGKQA